MKVDFTLTEICLLKVLVTNSLAKGLFSKAEHVNDAASILVKIDRLYNECVLAAQQSKRASKV
jgi:hypothetical protein